MKPDVMLDVMPSVDASSVFQSGTVSTSSMTRSMPASAAYSPFHAVAVVGADHRLGLRRQHQRHAERRHQRHRHQGDDQRHAALAAVVDDVSMRHHVLTVQDSGSCGATSNRIS